MCCRFGSCGFLKDLKNKSRTGCSIIFSDNLGAPTKQQIGLTKSTSYFDMQETVSKEAQIPVVDGYKICT